MKRYIWIIIIIIINRLNCSYGILSFWEITLMKSNVTPQTTYKKKRASNFSPAAHCQDFGKTMFASGLEYLQTRNSMRRKAVQIWAIVCGGLKSLKSGTFRPFHTFFMFFRAIFTNQTLVVVKFNILNWQGGFLGRVSSRDMSIWCVFIS